MTRNQCLLTALFSACTLSAAAQCPIKDQIMGDHPQQDVNARVPDGVTGATQVTKGEVCAKHKHQNCDVCRKEEKQARMQHHEGCCKAEHATENTNPHNALKLRAVDEEYSSFKTFRLGGYGEMVSAFKGYGINRFRGTQYGNTFENRATISIPRFVLALDYKLTKKWIVGAEIEFESGGTGIAYEIENSENGEYETEIEKGGEVAVEQFHLTRLIHPAFNVRVGHMIVPIGLTNTHHEPMNFFGTVRPEGETSIIPSTWHETGFAVYGSFGAKMAQFNYQAMVVSGLNADGFDRNNWVKKGKQGFFEQDNFTNPAYAARLDWVGVPGLRVGASVYYCSNTERNTDIPTRFAQIQGSIPVTLWSADVQWLNKYVEARANILSGHVGNSYALSAAKRNTDTKSPYSDLAPVAQRAISYAGEVGLNLKNVFACEKMPEIVPFFRYEYYNPQEEGGSLNGNTVVMDNRLKTSMWTAGVNYRIGKGIILKADYTYRSLNDGKMHPEKEFAIGAAFNAWFLNK